MGMIRFMMIACDYFWQYFFIFSTFQYLETYSINWVYPIFCNHLSKHNVPTPPNRNQFTNPVPDNRQVTPGRKQAKQHWRHCSEYRDDINQTKETRNVRQNIRDKEGANRYVYFAI